MKIRGILHYSLGGFVCIRGFAPLGGLEEISQADMNFQRNLIATQRDEIVAFLSQTEYLFFPEVILSLRLKRGNNDRGTSSLQNLDTLKYFTCHDRKISFNVRYSTFVSATDTRYRDKLQFVEVTIDDTFVKTQKPFLRIDGNHRLSAATEKSSFYDYPTPFCIVLFEDAAYEMGISRNKFEQVIFHNINSKSVPLTSEESNKVTFQLFTADDLKHNQSFGLPYYYASLLKDRISQETLPNCYDSFYSDENDEYEFGSLLIQACIFLNSKGLLKDTKGFEDKIYRALINIDTLYERYDVLKKSNNGGLLCAFLYFYLHVKNKHYIESFAKWVVNNHIYKLHQDKPDYIADVFESIILSKRRQVFLSMPFGKRDCEAHYKTIQKVIGEINNEYEIEIKLMPLRVDEYVKGESYSISDEILKMISESGLLIANLTHMNANVYHEVGYMMGLAAAHSLDKSNVLLLLKNKNKDGIDVTDKEVGFNVRGYKQLRFDETIELEEPLKKELIKYYEL